VVKDLLPDLLPLLFEHRPAGKDNVVAGTIELNDLALNLSAHELVKVGNPSNVDKRCWKETADTEVHDQTTLDHFNHGALNRRSNLSRFLDPAPSLLEARTLAGKDQATFLVLLSENKCVDLFTNRDFVVGIDRLADREFVSGDDSLALVSDVDENLVVIDPDDLA
jgi:hypothetical protein